MLRLLTFKEHKQVLKDIHTKNVKEIKNKEKIDKLRRERKIVDPTVGSGAFPVGMLNEIVKARATLSTFL